MANIPYGYQIIDGEAVFKPGEAGKVKMLVRYYLEGDAIKTAGEKAGIDLSISTLGHILKNPVYKGDRYYPAIIDEETFEKVQVERQERYEKLGCFTSNNAIPPAAVRWLFRLQPESEKEWSEWPDETKEVMNEPARKAAYIYTRVLPDRNGRQKMSSSEQLVMIDWIKEHMAQTV